MDTIVSNTAHTAHTALTAKSGRTIKFTPERFKQIRNLVERGMSREDIADTIGCTLGSLQVTCSRHGISLRRPRLVVDNPSNGGPRTVAHPCLDPTTESKMTDNDTPAEAEAKLYLRITYRGRERLSEIKLTTEQLNRLAVESFVRGISGVEMITEIIKAALEGKIK